MYLCDYKSARLVQTERRRVYSYAEVPPSLALKLNAKVLFYVKENIQSTSFVSVDVNGIV